jgi:hypothetical protein
MRGGLGNKPGLADPNLWWKTNTRDDGFEYYEYVLLYVDDVLAISHKAEEVLQWIDKFFPMRKGSIGPSEIYLGAKMSKVILPKDAVAWAMSASKYVQEATSNVEDYLK